MTLKYKNLFIIIALLTYMLHAKGQSEWPYDFTKGVITLEIDPFQEKVQGNVRYHIKTSRKIDSLYLEARDMAFHEVRFNGKEVDFKYDGRKLVVTKNLKPGKSYRLQLAYSAKPKQAIYFLGWQDSIPGNEQIWTQGQGKYNSHWVPSPDRMEEKIIFSMNVTFDREYTVIANGKLRKSKEMKDKRNWSYQMKKPMSSYLLGFAIGNYKALRTKSTGNIPITLYTYQQDSLKLEPTYRYTWRIFDFLESEIGVPYPWQNYKQVPVRDFLYAGMENTGTTFFSDRYVIDSLAFADLNYLNVNAHELAHQWFGNLVTETDAAQHWLHEGLATYYAYLAEQEIFGEDYILWKLWDTAQILREEDEKEKGESLIDPKASSLTFYEKGAWAALLLRETIGDRAFRNGIRNFLQSFAFKNATIPEFFSIMEESCACNLDAFQTKWFESDLFSYQECEDYLLARSPAIKQFKDIQQELISSPADNEQVLAQYWPGMTSEELRSRIILRYAKSLSMDFFEKVAGEGSLKVRQAVALAIPRVTSEIKSTYESFLGDPSYITMENALYKLWVSFPEDRVTYLEQTQGLVGLPNRSLRMTWLLLAMLTPDFGDSQSKKAYEEELRGYTSAVYGQDIRQNAFLLIREVLRPTDRYLLDLSQACVHHSWQFRSFARNLMEDLLQNESLRERVKGMLNRLDAEERTYLKNVLEL